MPLATRLRTSCAIAATVLVAAVALTGCSDDEQLGAQSTGTATTATATEPAPGTATDTGARTTTTGRRTERCTNEQAGYSVAHPADWYVNSGDVTAACSLFHPEPFEVPEAQDVTGIAIQIRREPVSFGRATGDDPGMRSVESERITVAGRPAVRRTYESTGRALLPEGVRGYQYLVDLGGETLIASTLDVGELDFQRNRRVLDRMMESLRLAG